MSFAAVGCALGNFEWVKGGLLGCGEPGALQRISGVLEGSLGFICSWGPHSPAQMQLFPALYCHGDPCALPSQRRWVVISRRCTLERMLA